MTRAQVEQLVLDRRASASLVESAEVEAYSRAADWVHRNAPDYASVPIRAVSEVHKITTEIPGMVEPPATRDRPGEWRKTGVGVGDVAASNPATIDADLHDWSESTRARGERHPIARAARHHAWFERIHPFVDGNGRVGRLPLNFLRIQSGCPPAVILASHRTRYLQALRIADGGRESDPRWPR